MLFASCWRQPAVLFIWLPGESGQLGSAGLKAPGAPFFEAPIPGLSLSLQVLGVQGTGAWEAPSPPTATPGRGATGRPLASCGSFPKGDVGLQSRGGRLCPKLKPYQALGEAGSSSGFRIRV